MVRKNSKDKIFLPTRGKSPPYISLWPWRQAFMWLIFWPRHESREYDSFRPRHESREYDSFRPRHESREYDSFLFCFISHCFLGCGFYRFVMFLGWSQPIVTAIIFGMTFCHCIFFFGWLRMLCTLSFFGHLIFGRDIFICLWPITLAMWSAQTQIVSQA